MENSPTNPAMHNKTMNMEPFVLIISAPVLLLLLLLLAISTMVVI